jgi:3-oxoacyl-(acyl-carrier-protein) synthase
MARAMELALADAALSPRAVHYVNAHGTGTLQNDRIEALALVRVFGAGGVPVSSTKSLVGHTMAASGSLEAVATVLALQNGLIPPTESSSGSESFDWPEHRSMAPPEVAMNSFGLVGRT